MEYPFNFMGESEIRQYQTGNPIEGYEGFVRVYKDGNFTLFRTWLENGERAWQCSVCECKSCSSAHV